MLIANSAGRPLFAERKDIRPKTENIGYATPVIKTFASDLNGEPLSNYNLILLQRRKDVYVNRMSRSAFRITTDYVYNTRFIWRDRRLFRHSSQYLRRVVSRFCAFYISLRVRKEKQRSSKTSRLAVAVREDFAPIPFPFIAYFAPFRRFSSTFL